MTDEGTVLSDNLKHWQFKMCSYNLTLKIGPFNSSIYIVIHRQLCFVLSEIVSVTRHISFPYLGSKPGRLKCHSKFLTIQPRGASSIEVNFKWL